MSHSVFRRYNRIPETAEFTYRLIELTFLEAGEFVMDDGGWHHMGGGCESGRWAQVERREGTKEPTPFITICSHEN